MAQGVLPYQYEAEKPTVGTTALGGLPVYLDLVKACGLVGSIRAYLRVAGAQSWLNDEEHGDEQVAEALTGEDPDIDEAVSTILNTTICRALAHFDFALETGEREPIETARALLATAGSLADNAENVPLWWISR